MLDLVADEGMGKRSRARFLALGVNGVGVALMIVVFAHTGGLVGAEVGVAGGTAVLAQRVLEAVFGDQAIRRLAQTAKDDLDARVQALMADELLRYHRILDGLGVEAEQARAAADSRRRGAEPPGPRGFPRWDCPMRARRRWRQRRSGRALEPPRVQPDPDAGRGIARGDRRRRAGRLAP